jgi:hypothetical protein
MAAIMVYEAAMKSFRSWSCILCPHHVSPLRGIPSMRRRKRQASTEIDVYMFAYY